MRYLIPLLRETRQYRVQLGALGNNVGVQLASALMLKVLLPFALLQAELQAERTYAFMDPCDLLPCNPFKAYLQALHNSGGVWYSPCTTAIDFLSQLTTIKP